MKTYRAVSKAGRTKFISARTYSDAFSQASSWAGGDLLESFEEV